MQCYCGKMNINTITHTKRTNILFSHRMFSMWRWKPFKWCIRHNKYNNNEATHSMCICLLLMIFMRLCPDGAECQKKKSASEITFVPHSLEYHSIIRLKAVEREREKEKRVRPPGLRRPPNKTKNIEFD